MTRLHRLQKRLLFSEFHLFGVTQTAFELRLHVCSLSFRVVLLQEFLKLHYAITDPFLLRIIKINDINGVLLRATPPAGVSSLLDGYETRTSF
jgi:hypothetical protein